MKIVEQELILNLKEAEGKHIIIYDCEKTARSATIRLKKVMCGKKGCTKCPHSIYAYARYRVGKKVIETYLGVAR